MISAEEARLKAQTCISEKDQELLNKIEEAVARSINKGKFGCYVGGWASGNVMTQLQKLGYRATNHSDQRDGSYIEISW